MKKEVIEALLSELVETVPLSFQIDLAGSCAVKRVVLSMAPRSATRLL